jgi:hypothetical protein
LNGPLEAGAMLTFEFSHSLDSDRIQLPHSLSKSIRQRLVYTFRAGLVG